MTWRRERSRQESWKKRECFPLQPCQCIIIVLLGSRDRIVLRFQGTFPRKSIIVPTTHYLTSTTIRNSEETLDEINVSMYRMLVIFAI